MKKSVFVFAVLFIVVAALAFCHAEAESVAGGNCGNSGVNGDNLKWTLDDTGLLTISGTG